MVDDAQRDDASPDRNAATRHLTDSAPAETAPSYADGTVSAHLDVDSYAEMIYRANLHSNLSSGQIEYDSTLELRDLLAQASAAPAVKRRRHHRM